MYTYYVVYVLPKTHVCMVCTFVLIRKHYVAFDACTIQAAMHAQLMQPWPTHLAVLLPILYSKLSCIIAFSTPRLPAEWWQI